MPFACLTVFLVIGQRLVREGLAWLLSDEPDFEVVGACATVEEALPALSVHRVDVVLLDIDSQREQVPAFFEELRQAGFTGRVVIVTAEVGEEEAAEFARLGAAGIFLKESPPSLLVERIRQGGNRKSWNGGPRGAGEDEGARRFSERERSVLRGIMEGLPNREIGRRLSISESLVKAAVQQLFKKTGVNTRGQLVKEALEKYRGQF